jgi:hypothetical protein
MDGCGHVGCVLAAGMLRYEAACAAVSAGSEAGSDGVDPGSDQRERWRSQARQWLRAELSDLSRNIRTNGWDRDRIRVVLEKWKRSPELGVVRSTEALASLPEKEQILW